MARHSARNKSAKIRLVESKLKMLKDICFAMNWDRPLVGLEQDILALEQASQELHFNPWQMGSR